MATCSECTYMDLSKERDNDGKYWCSSKGEYRYADCAECWNFCRAYSRSSSVAESYRDRSREKQSSGGCFITTAVCDILGMKDDNFYLAILRIFRDNYLQKKPETIEILEEYDFIGPIISSYMEKDCKKEETANNVFVKGIVPIVDDICNKKYNLAVKKYLNMTKCLINLYELDALKLNVPKFKKFDYSKDYSTYGHGRSK